MSEEEVLINETQAELTRLRTELVNLHYWAKQVLDDGADPQHIAEYLCVAADALANGDPMPASPYAGDSGYF